MLPKLALFGLCKGLILTFIPFLLQIDNDPQITVKSHVHNADRDRSHPTLVRFEEISDEEFHIAGFGSCDYCSCPAFTESHNDSYMCACGHSWYDHFSAGA